MLDTHKQDGTVIRVLPREDKEYKSGEKKGKKFAIDRFVIQNGTSQYDDIMAFEVFSDAERHPWKDCGGVKVGDLVTVNFVVKSREYNGKFYNDIRAFRIEHRNLEGDKIQTAQTEAKFPEVQARGGEVGASVGQDTDDLPF